MDAVATTGQSSALIAALSERETRLAELEVKLRAQKAAPEATKLELKRVGEQARKRIERLRDSLARNPEEARVVVTSLLRGGRIAARSVQTPEGRRFLLEGTAAIGRLLAGEPLLNSASPRGFEPLLQP